MNDQTIGETLQALRARAGMSLREVAERAGYSGPSSVQAFFAEHYNPPALDNIVARRLASALAGRGTPLIREAEVLALSAFSPEERQTVLASNVDERPDNDKIAIVRTGEVGRRGWRVDDRLVTLEAFNIDIDKVVAFAKAPPGIRNLDDTFIFHMTGDALAPRYYSGEPALFESWRTPGRGDFVVLVLMEALSSTEADIPHLNAVAGQLVRRSERGFQLRQFLPARAAWVPANAVAAVFRIMPWAEVCGLSYA